MVQVACTAGHQAHDAEKAGELLPRHTLEILAEQSAEQSQYERRILEISADEDAEWSWIAKHTETNGG
jgi:hypothetical protein